VCRLPLHQHVQHAQICRFAHLSNTTTQQGRAETATTVCKVWNSLLKAAAACLLQSGKDNCTAVSVLQHHISYMIACQVANDSCSSQDCYI
jgi:hypothetical protein